MKPTVLWLQRGKKWHAWVKGGKSTVCGQLSAADLIEQPAQAVQATISAEENACLTCIKGLKGVLGSAAPTANPHTNATAGAWYGNLNRQLAHRRIAPPANAIVLFAERLAEIGPPSAEEARQTYSEVAGLLLNPVVLRRAGNYANSRVRTVQTLPHLAAALKHCAPGAKDLLRVAAALREWRLVTGREVTLERCRIDHVVAAMLQIPDYPHYLQHLRKRGLENLAVLFHQNTLDRAKKDPALRGLFAGSTGYWADTASQLNVIRD